MQPNQVSGASFKDCSLKGTDFSLAKGVASADFSGATELNAPGYGNHGTDVGQASLVW